MSVKPRHMQGTHDKEEEDRATGVTLGSTRGDDKTTVALRTIRLCLSGYGG